jgi:hypothetical protein
MSEDKEKTLDEILNGAPEDNGLSPEYLQYLEDEALTQKLKLQRRKTAKEPSAETNPLHLKT